MLITVLCKEYNPQITALINHHYFNFHGLLSSNFISSRADKFFNVMKLSASHFLLRSQIKNLILKVDHVQLVLRFRNCKDLPKYH